MLHLLLYIFGKNRFDSYSMRSLIFLTAILLGCFAAHAKGKPMVQVTTRVAAAEKARDIQLSFTLKNISTSDLFLPDFHDPELNVTYLFDLEIHQATSPAPLKLLRFLASVKSAHARPTRVKLKTGSEYAYLIPLKLWSVIHTKPPIYREFAPGTYTVQGVWRPTMPKNEMIELGMTWFETNQIELSAPAKLMVF